MNNRVLSLDTLRGYAIITMILSGQILLNHMPRWMAHAQVPPGVGFSPNIYGITWVDLVFPFFLFAMGAAFPFSIGSKLRKNQPKAKLIFDAFIRGVQLVFFALFFHYMRPHMISQAPITVSACLITLLSFTLMFFMFMEIDFSKRTKSKNPWIYTWIVKILAFVCGYILMANLEFEGTKKLIFDPYSSDIILVVLGNMAFVGGVIYIFTYNKPIYRLAILPFILAVFLGSTTDGWVKEFYIYTPIPWAYKFYYLKYLFIVILGSIAGEYLYEWSSTRKNFDKTPKDNRQAYLLLVVSLAIIVCNVTLLYTRQLVLNLALTSVLLVVSHYILKSNENSFVSLWKKLFVAGAYALMLGLFLESYEGGIRKDSSTYSYYFVTSGLAFFALMFFSIVCDYLQQTKATSFLVKTGQNPMIAYVTTSMLVMPILILLGVTQYFDVFENGVWMGLLRGVIFTTLAVLVTMFFTNKKWYWRT